MLWLADGRSVVRFADGTARDLPLPDGVPPRGVRALLPEGEDACTALTHGSLARLSVAAVRRFPQLPLAGRSRVFGHARGPDGRIWASTVSGVVRFGWAGGAPVDPIPTTEVGGLPFGEARGISVGPKGDVFVGTDGSGVLRWNGRDFERFGPAAGLPTGIARVVLARPEAVWIGTDRGIYLLSEGRARPFAEVNAALDDPYVSAMVEAGGDVWVASSYSVFRVSGGRVLEKIDHSSGLAGASLSAEGCLAPLPGGRLAIGTIGGLSILDLGRARRSAPVPDVAIAGAVDATGRPVTAGRSIPFSAGSVTFALRSATFVAEERTLFSERLLPIESAYSPPHAEPRARYAGLPAGKYTLEVRATSAAGVASPRPARLHFEVAPPWWGTLLARLGFAALFLSAAGVAVGVRTRSLRRRAADLEARVEERTRELRSANARLEEAEARIAQLLESRPGPTPRPPRREPSWPPERRRSSRRGAQPASSWAPSPSRRGPPGTSRGEGSSPASPTSSAEHSRSGA